jgi:hypothetical protein
MIFHNTTVNFKAVVQWSGSMPFYGGFEDNQSRHFYAAIGGRT